MLLFFDMFQLCWLEKQTAAESYYLLLNQYEQNSWRFQSHIISQILEEHVEQLIKKNTQLCRYLFFLYREVLIKFQSKHWWPYQWLRCYSSWSETWTGLLLSRPCLFWLPMPPSNIPISPYANNLKWINQGK